MGYFEKQQLDGLKLLLNHLAVPWDFAEDCEAAAPVPASSAADFCGHVSSLEHEGLRAVLSGCARHGGALRRRNCGVLFPACERRGLCNPQFEQGERVNGWGRLIFHVAHVDALWRRFNKLGFEPEKPQNASWGERYFHLLDPDGHELSFARPLK